MIEIAIAFVGGVVVGVVALVAWLCWEEVSAFNRCGGCRKGKGGDKANREMGEFPVAGGRAMEADRGDSGLRGVRPGAASVVAPRESAAGEGLDR